MAGRKCSTTATVELKRSVVPAGGEKKLEADAGLPRKIIEAGVGRFRAKKIQRRKRG